MIPILISNYHGGDVLKLCIESIRRHTKPGTYRIIVGNDYDPMQADNAYLKECAASGLVEVVHAKDRLHHGGILNLLWNETLPSDAAVAVNLDNDTQVLADGWLDDLVGPVLKAGALGACDARPFNVVSTQGYVPPFYRFWFAALSVPKYREMGGIDWRFAYADRRDYPYSEMFRDVEAMDLPQKRSRDFDDNRVAIDPGCKLWVKVHWDNPKGYKIAPLPSGMSRKFRHIGHVSHYVDIPDDYEPGTRREKQTRRDFVRSELERLRCLA